MGFVLLGVVFPTLWVEWEGESVYEKCTALNCTEFVQTHIDMAYLSDSGANVTVTDTTFVVELPAVNNQALAAKYTNVTGSEILVGGGIINAYEYVKSCGSGYYENCVENNDMLVNNVFLVFGLWLLQFQLVIYLAIYFSSLSICPCKKCCFDPCKKCCFDVRAVKYDGDANKNKQYMKQLPLLVWIYFCNLILQSAFALVLNQNASATTDAEGISGWATTSQSLAWVSVGISAVAFLMLVFEPGKVDYTPAVALSANLRKTYEFRL
jgi:hypothetical protein